MLWHIVSLDTASLDGAQRLELADELKRLAQIPEIQWFHLGVDVERPNVTVFISVLDGQAALGRYRQDPIHLQVAESIRGFGMRAQRLDLEGLPVPT